MRKHDVKEIGLEIDSFEPFSNDSYEGITISWSSKIGFGQYTIFKDKSENDSKWKADSETMDCNEDKEFVTELMRLFIEQLNILG